MKTENITSTLAEQNVYINQFRMESKGDFLHESEYESITRRVDSGKLKHKLKDMKKIISGMI